MQIVTSEWTLAAGYRKQKRIEIEEITRSCACCYKEWNVFVNPQMRLQHLHELFGANLHSLLGGQFGSGSFENESQCSSHAQNLPQNKREN